MEFSGMIKKEKIIWNFQGSWFQALKVPMGVTKFCGVSGEKLCFFWNFEGQNRKPKNSGGLKKVLNPPFVFFWKRPFTEK